MDEQLSVLTFPGAEFLPVLIPEQFSYNSWAKGKDGSILLIFFSKCGPFLGFAWFSCWNCFLQLWQMSLAPLSFSGWKYFPLCAKWASHHPALGPTHPPLHGLVPGEVDGWKLQNGLSENLILNISSVKNWSWIFSFVNIITWLLAEWKYDYKYWLNENMT